MMTPSELKNAIALNLIDPRLFSIQFFISELSSFFYKVTGQTKTYMTSLDDIISYIESSDTSLSVALFTLIKSDDSIIQPFQITVTGLYLDLEKMRQVGNINLDLITSTFGRGYKNEGHELSFRLNYMNDGDQELPIKITKVLLV